MPDGNDSTENPHEGQIWPPDATTGTEQTESPVAYRVVTAAMLAEQTTIVSEGDTPTHDALAAEYGFLLISR